MQLLSGKIILLNRRSKKEQNNLVCKATSLCSPIGRTLALTSSSPFVDVPLRVIFTILFHLKQTKAFSS